MLVSVSVAVPVLVKAVEALMTLEMFRFVAVLRTSSPAGAVSVPPEIRGALPVHIRPPEVERQGPPLRSLTKGGPTSFKRVELWPM